MPGERSLSQRWQDYRPSKAVWVWSCIGAIFLTMILGFTAGGWVTGGTATEMAERATRNAREALVASLCVENFVTAPGASGNLSELKDTSSWEQDDFISDGGWITIEGLKSQIPGAADICADRLVAMESIPVRTVAPDEVKADG